MKIASFFIALFCLVLSGCDPCANVDCGPGGTCDGEGNCQCDPGYSGSRCQNYDPCHDVTCLNGGYCADGTCKCPTGYTGANCQIALTPKTMVIEKVVVRSYPRARQNGNGWDALYAGSSNAADLLAQIKRDGVSKGYSYYLSNCLVNQDYHLTMNPAVYYQPVTGRCDVELYDYDSNTSQEYIGGYYFYPSNYTKTYPSVIELYNSSAWHKIKMDVHVRWLF